MAETTQRAYTLRLNGPKPAAPAAPAAPANPAGPANPVATANPDWRKALWETHSAINKGAHAFGDCLLTLRGGIDHILADDVTRDEKDTDETFKAKIKGRRILLALSWLSVESEVGAPKDFIIASGTENKNTRKEKVILNLRCILKKKMAGDEVLDALRKEEIIEAWVKDCEASLSAVIREDAVWVNRSAAFDIFNDELAASKKPKITSEDVWDMLRPFLDDAEDYLAPVKASQESNPEQIEDGKEPNQKIKDNESKKVVEAGNWLSSRFGTDEGANYCRLAAVYSIITEWASSPHEEMTGPQAFVAIGLEIKRAYERAYNEINPNETTTNLKNALYDIENNLRAFAPETIDLMEIKNLISGIGHKSTTRKLLDSIAVKNNVNQEGFSALKEQASVNLKHCQKKIGLKGIRSYSNTIMQVVEEACGFTYRVDAEDEPVSAANYSDFAAEYSWGTSRHLQFVVMLDHAARRASSAHTWIKQAEANRNQFEANVQMLGRVYETAKAWLENYCQERSSTTGALEQYRIRKRAIGGWKKLVTIWGGNSCRTPEDRLAAARALQDDLEDEKFGDIQLFEALAAEDAKCVWHHDGNPDSAADHQQLIDFVFAKEAEFEKQHFKVPMYRHPDALLHPVFCDFGNSRMGIRFDIYMNALKAAKKETKEPKTADSSKKSEANKKNSADSLHGLSMDLWDGKEIKNLALTWQSKRLVRDLALKQTVQENAGGEAVKNVTRADRLGRVAAGAKNGERVVVEKLFHEKNHWNGRLQAPRQQLEEIAALIKKPGLSDEARNAKISRLIDRIRWLITFSVKLMPKPTPPDYFQITLPDRTKKSLPRPPGLRVLSVDLGHRYAAACAVWQTVSKEDVAKDCDEAGCNLPREGAIYFHLETKGTKKKKGIDTGVEITKRKIYRRIGPDTLINGTAYPAPWARLDRQFLIKLQGEEEGAREASNEEIWAVHRLEVDLGKTLPLIDELKRRGWGNIVEQANGIKNASNTSNAAVSEKGKQNQQSKRIEALKKLGWEPITAPVAANANNGQEPIFHGLSVSVDKLMSSAVKTLSYALKLHGNQARIAFAMTADYKTMPGNRKYYFSEAREMSANIDKATRENAHVEFILDALMTWYDLAYAHKYRDDQAKKLWEDKITHLEGYLILEDIAENVTKPERKSREEENRQRLHGVAKKIVQMPELRNELHEIWNKRWAEDDKKLQKQLLWFKHWVMPSGKGARSPAIRKVGGLSLIRIATFTEFRRKVQVGFFTRLQPDGTKKEIKEKYGQKALDALEHLRDQRVKQLASRIVEAALDCGRVKRHRKGNDPQRLDRNVDPPCHAIIIESLKYYRPDETRTRFENRQLMSWSSSKVKKYLEEACALHGLRLYEVPANYTSRQDSRTGAPGVRCKDLPVIEFMRSPYWRKQVKNANCNGDAFERFIIAMDNLWRGKTEAEWKIAVDIRIPVKGGDIFVSANKDSPAAKGLQADLNAAANIGLRKLLDPDWPGKWWYVPCNSTTFKPDPDSAKGSVAIKLDDALEDAPVVGNMEEKKKAKEKSKKDKPIVNLWRDVSEKEIRRGMGPWKVTSEYWNDVKERVIEILSSQNTGKVGKKKVTKKKKDKTPDEQHGF